MPHGRWQGASSWPLLLVYTEGSVGIIYVNEFSILGQTPLSSSAQINQKEGQPGDGVRRPRSFPRDKNQGFVARPRGVPAMGARGVRKRQDSRHARPRVC